MNETYEDVKILLTLWRYMFTGSTNKSSAAEHWGIKHSAQKFQARLFLNSPANSQSLWVITTSITMLIV